MMKVKIRKFTPEGSEEFRKLIAAKPDNLETEVAKLIIDEALTVVLQGELTVKAVKNRYELAETLWESFGSERPLHGHRSDRNLWNWVSAAYMSRLLADYPKHLWEEKMGQEVERWILTETTLRFHRHLVSGPFFAYEANYPEVKNAMCQLATPVLAPGELVERIAGKRSLSTGAVCQLATLLYYDSANRQLRAGHTAKPGNPKAFARYFTQIDRTTDYEGMQVEELLALLPENFKVWKECARQELSSHYSRK